MQNGVTLPPDFTLLQVVPELETGGAEQTTIDGAHAVVRIGGKALVAVNRVENFRATRAVVEIAAEHAYINAETAEALRVKGGDLVRVMA